MTKCFIGDCLGKKCISNVNSLQFHISEGKKYSLTLKALIRFACLKYANIHIYMTIYIEHMTYNRIKDKGSTLCADFEHSIFLCCTEKKSLKSEKGEISLHRTIFPHLFGHSTLLNLLALLLSVWYCKKLT